MRALLDVNVLIALLDSDHTSHRAAWEWFREHGHAGWASCPITQNGCIRIFAHPGYPNPRSDRSGTDEVYLRRIADGSAQWKVSTSGGVEPRWGAAGRELLYRGRDSIYSVAVTLGAEPTFALPKGLLADGFVRIGHEAYWDVSGDGKRFVFVRPARGSGMALHLLLNWFAQPNPLQQKP